MSDPDRVPFPRPRRKKIRLGDAVESIAKPVAKVIDKIAGTDIQNCGGCAKRKEVLNRLGGGIEN